MFQAEPDEDLGVDCYLEVADAGFGTNFVVAAQVKSGPSYRRNITQSSFDVYADKRDVYYWLGSNIPVFFLYHDQPTGAVFWRHVQTAFDEAADPEATRKLDFRCSEGILSDNPALANYVRELRNATPTALSRIEVVRANSCNFSVDNVLVSPSDVATHVVISKIIKHGDRSDSGLEYGGMSTVLGYGDNGRWVAVLDVAAVGQKCVDAWVRITDLSCWFELSFPVSTEQDFDSNVTITSALLDARLRAIQEALDKFEIRTPQELLGAAEIPANDVNQRLRIAFGSQTFCINLSHMAGRDALILTNSQYRPPRGAVLMVEDIRRAPYLGVELEKVISTKRYMSIYQVAVDRGRNVVTFGLRTNSEHACWGEPTFRHKHFQISELKRLCIDALRS